jgi:hypothetical protein
MTDLRQLQLTKVTELMGARLRFGDILQAATAHPGTVTELIAYSRISNNQTFLICTSLRLVTVTL